MGLQQSLVCTVVPTAIQVGASKLKVSVILSPRLSGATKLGSFTDWLHWTQSLQANGLEITFRCNGATHVESIDTNVLSPALWAYLFNEGTPVDSYAYPDYASCGVQTWPVRDGVNAIRAVYQNAAIELALPDALTGREARNRAIAANLLRPFAVHWDGREAPARRKATRMSRDRFLASEDPASSAALQNLPGVVAQASAQAATQRFASFSHMPMPPPDADGKPQKLPFDPDKALDFHQVLGALNAYPELMRKLGLIFDVTLPASFVAATSATHYKTIAVTKLGFAWRLQPQMPALETAYVHFKTASGKMQFQAAPRTLDTTASRPPVPAVGLLQFDETRFGLTQFDVDGGMHKVVMAAESMNPTTAAGMQRNVDPMARAIDAPNPEIFDPEATLPALRTGGFSLWADGRGRRLLTALGESAQINQQFQADQSPSRPFFAEDLVRGYRLDIWDSHTRGWHSLHQRTGIYRFGDAAKALAGPDPANPQLPQLAPDEGFVQLSTAQPAPGSSPVENDLYVHESMARWAGWSLSAPRPFSYLGTEPVPSTRGPDDPDANPAVTPFKLRTSFKVLPGTLPVLRFGRRYRVRARVVDLAANSLPPDSPIAAELAVHDALPLEPEGEAYLRFEPVIAPQLVVRNVESLTDPGSAIDRIVIRSYNDATNGDSVAVDRATGDRHVVPPRTSVELAEVHGMFDGADGKLDPSTFDEIKKRDGAELPQVEEPDLKGAKAKFPLVPGDRIDDLPFLPDPLARAAAFRDLPGTPSGAVGHAAPDDAQPGSVHYHPLGDPNPRPGSATLVGFGAGDWRARKGFRFSLDEPPTGPGPARPRWDATTRVLTAYLPKGTSCVVALSSQVPPTELRLLAVWKWLREYVEFSNLVDGEAKKLDGGSQVDRIAHILQRAVEGGHWMLTPPKLVTLVHATQQPIGRPRFAALDVDHDPTYDNDRSLQTAPILSRQDPAELAPITAFRHLGETAAFLVGALQVHASSTVRIDLYAEWRDKIDDLSQPKWRREFRSALADEIPVPGVREGYLVSSGRDKRFVGYLDPEHAQIAFVRNGDRAGPGAPTGAYFSDAAPRHVFEDTKHRRVTYTAVATSRFREYFADQTIDFTRTSEPVVVDIPASARPLAPDIAYVVPTFGWQRQFATDIKRSVRFGGGLRVYLRRPWFSSGDGELLGVAAWSQASPNYEPTQEDLERLKPYVTRWGMDPIWKTGALGGVPRLDDFEGAVARAVGVTLEERSADSPGQGRARVDVCGFETGYDHDRQLWYADLTLNTPGDTYAPFVRLALVRFQPHALADARISRVVLAEFAQLTPDRSLLAVADPAKPRRVRVTVSGTAPTGPAAIAPGVSTAFVPARSPNGIRVRVQRRAATSDNELLWRDVPVAEATVTRIFGGGDPFNANLELWFGTIDFAVGVPAADYRLLVEEFEFYSGDYTVDDETGRHAPGRLIYAEAVPVDEAIVMGA
jgi:hypothetical protein